MLDIQSLHNEVKESVPTFIVEQFNPQSKDDWKDLSKLAYDIADYIDNMIVTLYSEKSAKDIFEMSIFSYFYFRVGMYAMTHGE